MKGYQQACLLNTIKLFFMLNADMNEEDQLVADSFSCNYMIMSVTSLTSLHFQNKEEQHFLAATYHYGNFSLKFLTWKMATPILNKMDMEILGIWKNLALKKKLLILYNP